MEVSLRPDLVTLQIAGAGRFEVQSGQAITVTPEAGAQLNTVQLYLLGSAWSAKRSTWYSYIVLAVPQFALK